MQLTDWILGKVALLLIGLIKISLENPSFDHLPVIDRLCLRALTQLSPLSGVALQVRQAT